MKCIQLFNDLGIIRESLNNREAEADQANIGANSMPGCPDAQSEQVMRLLQSCSFDISTRVYNSILELDTTDIARMSVACKGLQDISRDCPPLLNTCYSREDVKAQRMHTKEEMLNNPFMGKLYAFKLVLIY